MLFTGRKIKKTMKKQLSMVLNSQQYMFPYKHTDLMVTDR